MNTFNNFSPLAFREKSMKATYKKWYAYGKEFALPFSTTELPPFQFTVANLPSFDPTTVEVFLVNEATGVRGATGIKIKVDAMDGHGSVLYVSPGSNVYAKSIEPGVYRAEFAIPGGETYVSTPICVTEGIETNTNFVKLEYWNDEKLAYPNGFVTTGTDNDFKFQMYIPTTFFKPKYEFEEEITKRAGYKFLELQTCNKVFGFNFLAPEYICDALRLVRLSDYIRFTHDGEYYNALNFEYNPDWQDNGYLAAIECQFETDTIIQKLPSFNRRDRESFYNALLADIDTPILFSPDVVGLYYREYKQGEPTIKGKLIRELSPIDLIDENTTIAVDMGAGEARKFNLYRMLEGYISKNHEDVTEFLLSLRGGVNIGTPNASGEYPANVDRDGNAKLKNIQGGDAVLGNVDGAKSRFDSVETGFFTVNNTAATIDAMGNTDVNDLTARGDSMLRSDVYTGSKNGSPTGKITKEGQLQYLSAIIYEFLSSETFVPGFLGEGFKIWLENGNWHIECDNLTVRQTMNIFELLIQKIRSVNGAIVVSQSNGKLSAVEEVGTQYKLTTGEEFPTFQEGDLVRCQTFAGYQGAGLTFDFTQFAKFDYSGSDFDSNLVDVTSDSISFNLNNTGNSGFTLYKYGTSSPTPIEIPSFTLTFEGGYPGMMAIAAGLDSNDSPVESAGVLLQNGDNVIPAITAAQGIHNFAITVVGDSGHGTGRVTVKQKRAAGSAPNNSLVKFYWVEVKRVEGTSFFADKSEFNNVVPAIGDEVVQMGNTKNAERQALIYITAQESGKPYIEILNGVKTKSLTGTDRTRLGDLSNIVDPDFTGEAAVKGTGFYSTNAFLKGIFVLRNGKRVEDEIKIAKDAADQAAQDAANAAQSAQEAKDRLNKWADDGLISPPEKPALIDEGKRIQAEHLSILADASKYGVSATVYTQAYNDYLGQLQYHSAPTPENIVVLAGLAESQTTYYNQRNLILSAIADAAKAYVDEADKKLKEYLDTEITAIPGKIELAVRSLKVSTGNLLKNSNRTQEFRNYLFGRYAYNVFPISGRDYTLTVCYTLGANNTEIQVYADGGQNYIQRFNTKGNAVIESKKVVFDKFQDRSGMTFYQLPSGTYESKIHWAVLSEGNVGTTNWLPSTNEELVGGQNLVLNSGVCISDYRLFGMSKSYYELRGKTVCISFDYEYSNLVLGSNNRFGIETEVPTGGGTAYFGTWIYLDSTSPTSAKGRKTYVYNLRDDIEDNGLKHIQAHVQVGAGTVVTMCNFQVEIGYTPTEWKPAPEDTLNESIKYTDTQILAIDGKIELSVTTKVNQIGVGGDNLFQYYASAPYSYAPYNSTPVVKDGYVLETTFNATNPTSFITLGNKGVGIMADFCYRFRMLINGSPAPESAFVGKAITTYAASGEIYYGGDGVFFGFVKGNKGDLIFHVPTSGISGGNVIRIEQMIVAKGTVCPNFSPASEDVRFNNEKFTQSKIDIVEGKITSTVEQINAVDGKVTGLASRVTQTESSINSIVGDVNVLNNTTDRHATKQIDLTGWDNNKFFPLIISMQVYHKSMVEISRPLDAGYGKPSYGTHDSGFSMNLTFEMSGSGWGSLPAVTNIFDYTKAWTSAGAKIVVDLGQITETSTCVMGIRGGSKYDVTVHDTTDTNIIQVYQTDYHGSYNTSFPVRTDGTEPVRTYGYYTEIKQTQESITATAAKVDDQGRRLSAAELTLSSDHAKLSVVEQTANTANTTATNANDKADTVDGRVTATQNGLVETGINITSRKIVLKSDNVLFQNNAGQQTAALNANGRLTANVIEAGEVVANGFAAQRITTGNLTVTDGAVIGGMSITGGKLTGSSIALTKGATIGNFSLHESNRLQGHNGAIIELFEPNHTTGGNEVELSPGQLFAQQNSSTIDALNLNGVGNVTMRISKFNIVQSTEFNLNTSKVVVSGATTWKAPGVHYAAVVNTNGNILQRWGNPSISANATNLSTGRYRVYVSGVSSTGFIPMVMACSSSKWVNVCVEEFAFTSNYFTVKLMDVNTGLLNTEFIFYICGWV